MSVEAWSTADLCDRHADTIAVCELPFLQFGAHRSFAGPVATVAWPAPPDQVF